jgi:acyl-CoA synthetase (AMP-forming)/AMP-acid ligase II
VCLTFLTPEDHRRALVGRPELLQSCGRPLVGTQVRIVDSSDAATPAGVVGEIVARGPQLMKEYWRLPEDTDRALRGGWLHTGDAGYCDEDGYIYVSDRIKDMIVSGGENVYPREVEDVLFEMPGVADCAVIGVPDGRWGETVKAVVVVRAGEHLTADEVVTWCGERLAGFKRPRSVDFVERLPRNPSGKVLKNELRKRYWSGRGRAVG